MSNYPENVTRDKPSSIEQIRLYYTTKEDRHPVELTDKQEEVRQRLVAAHALLLRKGSTEAALKIFCRRFKVSDRQGRRDLVDAINLFGDVMKSEKEGRRYLLYEKAMATYQIALKRGDIKGQNKALEIAMKLMSLDKDDPDMPNFEKLQPSVNILMLPEGVEDGIISALRAGVVSFGAKQKQPRTINIEHEEV